MTPPDHAADLAHAEACLRGEGDALRRFAAEQGALIDAVLARMDLGERAFDLRQVILEKLLVADGDRPPRLAAYRGRGRLTSWVRAVTVRAAVDLMRVGRPEIPTDDEVLARVAAGASSDPELAVLRRRDGARVKAALAEAFGALSVRERGVLRHHALHGLTIDEIAAIYGTHRVTAFRWLERARKALRDRTHELLGEELGATPHEAASLVRMLDGRLELSLARLLGSGCEQGGR